MTGRDSRWKLATRKRNREHGTQNEPLEIQVLRESAKHFEFFVRIPVFHVPSLSAASIPQFDRNGALAQQVLVDRLDAFGDRARIVVLADGLSQCGSQVTPRTIVL